MMCSIIEAEDWTSESKEEPASFNLACVIAQLRESF